MFSGVDFRASSFESYEFVGEVRGVWFRGVYELPSILEQFANPQPNRMIAVSFQNAKLIDVTFSDGCDLSAVIPPDDGRHKVFDRWLKRIKFVFEESRAWQEPYRRDADLFYKSCEAHAQNQDWYLIGVDDLVNLYGKDSSTKIWSTLLSTCATLK